MPTPLLGRLRLGGRIEGRWRRCRTVTEQGRGFDFIQRPVRRDIAAGAKNPIFGIGGARQPHGFCKGLVDLTGFEPGMCALISCLRLRGWGIDAMDRHDRAQFALEPGPPAFLGPAAAQCRSKFFKIGSQAVEPHRVARRCDDCGNRSLMCRAEALDQQRLEIAERYAAFDRASCGECHQKRVGASC